MEILISEMTIEYALLVTRWTYDGIYSIYNHGEAFVTDCMDGMHFAFLDLNRELLGYLCYGIEAKIPTVEADVYDDNYLDIGLHIRPDLTGKKLGSSFLRACLKYAQKTFDANNYRATIASFNERALNLCVHSGFYVDQTVTHLITGSKFIVVKMDTQQIDGN